LAVACVPLISSHSRENIENSAALDLGVSFKKVKMVATELAAIAKNLVKNVANGEKVALESFWAEQSCVLIFLRRFACPWCRVDALKHSEILEKLEKNNVKMVAFGHEEVGLQDFLDGKFWKGEVYIDEGKACYSALGYKRYNAVSILTTVFTSGGRAKTDEAKRMNVGGDITTGDGKQNGGLLVIEKGGEKVLLNFAQGSPDQAVPNDDILKALGILEA